MQNSNKPSVSGQELDNLLKQAFLNLDVTNPKHTDLMETVADHTLNKRIPFTGAKGSFTFLKWLLAVVSVLSAFLVASYYMSAGPAEEEPSVVKILVPSLAKEESAATKEMALVESREEPPLKSLDSREQKQVSDQSLSTPFVQSPPHEQKPSIAFMNSEKTMQKDTGYVFPVLSDEEEDANNKRKEKLLMQAIKLSAGKYAMIPQVYMESAYFYSNSPFKAVYMQTTEVSNIEYKTFLFDLLIRNDKAGFLKAKPRQALWNTIYDKDLGKYFEDMYFSDKAYNNHPVVNVSREGAELYCKWLEEESRDLADEKDLTFNSTYRLPTAKDWAYAAEGGKVGNVYPWDGQFMRNARGIYEANFCVEKEKPGASSASAPYTTAGIGLGAGQIALTCRVDGFKPNEFGLYTMSGNVAEFVLDDSTGQLLTKGGSWNSSPEALKISSREVVEGNGASPYHGFRPLVGVKLFRTAFSYRDTDTTFSYRDTSSAFSYFGYNPVKVVVPVVTDPLSGVTLGGDTIFLFPHFSKKELKEGRERKEKMMKALSSFHKEAYAFVPMGSCFYHSETVSSRSFYMQTTEVSNAEYKAFLIDLYLKGEREEFRKCQPEQYQWTKKFHSGYDDPMREMYFGLLSYNNYPVTNVSRYGAEAYCKWLTVETNKQQAAAGKALINDARLPSDMEWAMAATNKKNHVRYANGLDSLQDVKKKYMVNYSCQPFASAWRDTLLDMYTFRNKLTGPGYNADGNFYTAEVRSYEPNLYGIYNLGGNVSEMVYLWDTATNKAKGFGTKGGSWFSTDYFLEIDAAQEFMHPERASPFTGFRIVVSAAEVKK